MSTNSVAERRLRIDIAILKEMLEKTEIESIIWVPTNLQLADVLTKSPYNLSEVLEWHDKFSQTKGRILMLICS